MSRFHSRKSPSEHGDLSEPWKDAVGRSVLYRVTTPFEESGGESGKAICVVGQAGMPLRVIGFQSFAQDSASIQIYEDEGQKLDKRLHNGQVAFYGAFQVPQELIDGHTICT